MTGDTLFLEGCGRTDLPGGDPAALYESLTQKLAKVPDDAVLFPGHLYSAEPSQSMARHPALELRVHAEVRGAVAGHVRQLTHQLPPPPPPPPPPTPPPPPPPPLDDGAVAARLVLEASIGARKT